MIDIQLLRNDLDTVAKRLATRAGYALDVARFASSEGKRKEMQQAVERNASRRNRIAREIGHARGQN
jgi:seryl-tRNA synthetase